MSDVFFNSVKEAMENNTPHSRWKKVQLAKVLLKIIDPLTGLPTEIIIEGDPAKDGDAVIYNCWSAYETAHLERNNKYHILNGIIIRYGKDMETQTTDNAISDEEIDVVLGKKNMALVNLLKKLNSTTAVKRVLDRAIEKNKPILTIKEIETRLAELQQAEYGSD